MEHTVALSVFAVLPRLPAVLVARNILPAAPVLGRARNVLAGRPMDGQSPGGRGRRSCFWLQRADLLFDHVAGVCFVAGLDAMGGPRRGTSLAHGRTMGN